MMKKWMKGIVVAGVSLLVANSVFAAAMELDMGAGSVYWTNAEAWTANTVPVNGDSIYIRRNNTITLDVAAGAMNVLHIGGASSYGYTGTVNIVSGGSLTTTNSGAGTTSRSAVGAPAVGAVGYLNLSGGTLNIGATGGNVLHVGVDPGANTNTTGIFTISGGTFNGRLLVGSAQATDVAGSDKVRIVGSGATIGTSDTTGNALEVRASGLLEFIFDATGISTMNYAGTASFATGSQIIIDGAAYTGGANTFTLIEAGVLSQITQPTISLINFAEGTTYDYNTTTDTLTVTTAVPEPATIGMIGVGALVAMIVRRQMRK